MAWETKATLDAETTVSLGGKDKATGKVNPTALEGYFLGNRPTPDQGYGEGVLHIFQTQNGNVGVWGKTNSIRLMTDEHIGQMCLLTFTGMSKPKKGRNPAYLYKLQFDKTNTIDVSAIETATADAEPDYSEGVQETDVAEEDTTESYVSQPAPARATPPKAAPRTPSAEQQARVKAALAGRKTA